MASPPFLRVPLEIRLQIYRLLLVDEPSEFTTHLSLLPEYYEYEKDPNRFICSSQRILCIRTTHPNHFNLTAHKRTKLRTPYTIRSGRFRAQCMNVTYACVNAPPIQTNILATSKQIHAEASRLLYTSYTFDFDTNVEAIVPFLQDLTLHSRSYIRRLSLVKKALPYDKDFDRCEWRNMCNYIATNLALNDLSLGVVAGKPTIGADLIPLIPESQFHALITQHKADEMSWVRDLLRIKGLQKLDLRPCVEHCPPPQSNALMFFVAFSASVALGFNEYLQRQMIGAQPLG